MTATMGLRGPGAEHPHHRAGRGGHPPLQRRPLLGAGPPRQPRRGRGRQPRHRRQHLPGRVRGCRSNPTRKSSPANCAAMIPTSHSPPATPDPGPSSAPPPHPTPPPPPTDQPTPSPPPTPRSSSTTDPPPPPAHSTHHPAGHSADPDHPADHVSSSPGRCPSTRADRVLANRIIAGQQGTYRQPTPRVPALLADSGQDADTLRTRALQDAGTSGRGHFRTRAP